MNHNIMEALAIVLTEMSRGSLSPDELFAVSELLSRHGFSQPEITATLELLQRRLEGQFSTEGQREPSRGAWRLLTRSEQALLTNESSELLLQAQRNEWLSPLDVDAVLEMCQREAVIPVAKKEIIDIMTDVLMDKPTPGVGE